MPKKPSGMWPHLLAQLCNVKKWKKHAVLGFNNADSILKGLLMTFFLKEETITNYICYTSLKALENQSDGLKGRKQNKLRCFV